MSQENLFRFPVAETKNFLSKNERQNAKDECLKKSERDEISALSNTFSSIFGEKREKRRLY